MNSKADHLKSIDVTIDVSIPGVSQKTYTLRGKGEPATFQPLIFHYESDSERVVFVREIPTDFPAKADGAYEFNRITHQREFVKETGKLSAAGNQLEQHKQYDYETPTTHYSARHRYGCHS